MNKYIITHEKIKMQNREEQDFIVAALYNQGKKMIEVSLTPPDEDSLLGKCRTEYPGSFCEDFAGADLLFVFR